MCQQHEFGSRIKAENLLSFHCCSDPQNIQVDHAQGVQRPSCGLGPVTPQHRPQSLPPVQPGYVPSQRFALWVLRWWLLFWWCVSMPSMSCVNITRVWHTLPVVDCHAAQRVIPLHRHGRWVRCPSEDCFVLKESVFFSRNCFELKGSVFFPGDFWVKGFCLSWRLFWVKGICLSWRLFWVKGICLSLETVLS